MIKLFAAHMNKIVLTRAEPGASKLYTAKEEQMYNLAKERISNSDFYVTESYFRSISATNMKKSHPHFIFFRRNKIQISSTFPLKI